MSKVFSRLEASEYEAHRAIFVKWLEKLGVQCNVAQSPDSDDESVVGEVVELGGAPNNNNEEPDDNDYVFGNGTDGISINMSDLVENSSSLPVPSDTSEGQNPCPKQGVSGGILEFNPKSPGASSVRFFHCIDNPHSGFLFEKNKFCAK